MMPVSHPIESSRYRRTTTSTRWWRFWRHQVLSSPLHFRRQRVLEKASVNASSFKMPPIPVRCNARPAVPKSLLSAFAFSALAAESHRHGDAR